MSFVIFIVIWIVFTLFFLRKRDKNDPITWVFVGYTFLFGMYFFAGVQYTYDARLSGILYLLLNITLFNLACYLGKHSVFKQSRSVYQNYGFSNKRILLNQKSLNIFTILGFAGVLLYIVDLIIRNRLFSLSMILAVHANFSISVLGVIGSLFSPLLLVIWLYKCSIVDYDTKKFSIKDLFLVIVFVLPNILTSGRQVVFFTIISTAIVLLNNINLKARAKHALKKMSRNKKRMLRIIAILLVLFMIYMVFIIDSRSGYSNKVDYMPTTFGAVLSEQTRELCINAKALSGVLVEFIMYYSHELPNLQVYLDGYSGPYAFGGFQFHYIARRLNFLGINTDAVVNSAKEYVSSIGTDYHVYRTICGSSILDFGVIGTPFFIMLLGLISGMAYRKYTYGSNSFDGVKMALICAAVVFSIEYSPFQEQTIVYCLIWSLILRKVTYKRPRVLFNQKGAVQ